MVHSILGRVSGGEDLSMAEMAEVIDAIMQGSWEDEQIGLLLTALRAKGEAVSEIAGAAAAMRKHMTPIKTRRQGLVDTCGTGGDGSGTFNISTAAALVTAAAGVSVAKHGNRKITSKTGSADVLEALGVHVDASLPTVERCLDEVGICFCFAPQLHPAMRHVGHVRRKLGVPTIFNLLGPLSNPAGAPFQVLGVGRPELRASLAQALQLLGAQRAAVLCGEDGLDEVTLAGATHVSVVSADGVEEVTWTPADFGLERGDLSDLVVEGPAESARVIRGVLRGEPGPARDIVVMNAAAAIWTASEGKTLGDCAQLAAAAIDEGAGLHVLERLVDETR